MVTYLRMHLMLTKTWSLICLFFPPFYALPLWLYTPTYAISHMQRIDKCSGPKYFSNFIKIIIRSNKKFSGSLYPLRVMDSKLRFVPLKYWYELSVIQFLLYRRFGFGCSQWHFGGNKRALKRMSRISFLVMVKL